MRDWQIDCLFYRHFEPHASTIFLNQFFVHIHSIISWLICSLFFCLIYILKYSIFFCRTNWLWLLQNWRIQLHKICWFEEYQRCSTGRLLCSHSSLLGWAQRWSYRLINSRFINIALCLRIRYGKPLE